MTTLCRLCSQDITENEEDDSKLVQCKRCWKFTAKGRILSDEQMKGGNIKRMAAKKEKKSKKKAAVEKTESAEGTKTTEKAPKQEKGPSITDVRVENAEKIIKFMDDLKIDDVEKRKVCSRAYGVISAKLK